MNVNADQSRLPDNNSNAKTMEPLKTVVVDDDPITRNHLVEILGKFPEIEIVGICGNGLEAIRTINASSPQVVFLDIEMPEVDGFGVIESIDIHPHPSIVFVTAHDRYAFRAFEVRAVDYVIKPFDVSRIARAVERVKALYPELRSDNAPPLERKSSERFKNRFILKESDNYILLNADDIHYIQADGNYLNFHTVRKKYLIRHTLTDMVNKLDPDQFFRISRSSIVNIDAVEKIENHSYGNYLVHLQTGVTLKMSKNYADLLDSFTRI